MITIRPLSEADVATAAAMEAEHQPAPWPESVFRDELAAPSRVYLAADEGGLVGYAGALIVVDEAHVTNIFVEPGHRRGRLGRRLMVAPIEEAVAHCAPHLTLAMRARNPAARAPSASHGTGPVGTRPGDH